ncbi:unnamed protein product [Phyllotreta striolata]|uniref:Anamorsin homolog n=1 Tax=Phyllotreta striolata TaxID=444603 RepID=A0A9N9XV62_PHYSR|nr:unnamed protein product [Phyllotreta striolata]
MSFLKELKNSDEILLVESKTKSDVFTKLSNEFKNAKITSEEDIIKHESVPVVYCETPSSSILPKILKSLTNGGKIIITNVPDKEKIKLELITKGFMNVTTFDDYITADKPNFASGSTVQLKLPKKAVPPVWKLDDDLDGDEETIDPNELLDEDDLQKPDPSSLKVCSTTGKRKACKDCSCGLADELAMEAKLGKVVDTKDAPKSSCGSCYLGDAFRCATCPYLGMPAFKPGEKIQLMGNQLQADI